MIDLTGQIFGRLQVIKRNGSSHDKRALWLCKCDCGNEVSVVGRSLLNSKTRSCGCLHKQMLREKADDLSGKRFGRLTVMEKADYYIFSSGEQKIRWKCVCDCGNEVTVFASCLKKGTTKSCGCLQKELLSKRSKTHGKTNTRLYNVYCGMKYRCYNEKCLEYESYGGRRICICDEWKNDFQIFYDWAISNGYKEGLTIERKNVNGNYEPLNCTWISIQEQQWNKRNTHHFLYNGEKLNTKQVIEFLGVSKPTIRKYVKKFNGDFQKAADFILKNLKKR